ncbi:MAG: trimeric intracellular cation channel family protein, partial [Stackebrandtia sp.]
MHAVLYLWLNLAGTIVFAASGAAAAVGRRLDLFGVVVVGVVTALGGGVFRDVVIDRTPPLAFADWRYPTAAAVTAAAIFWMHAHVFRLRRTMLTLDAAGLALITDVGTTAALEAGVPWLGSGVIGVITGVGGGVIRDVLTAQIPAVLQREIYAVASLAGAAVIVIAAYFSLHTG